MLFIACNSVRVPKNKYYGSNVDFKRTIVKDSIVFDIKNTTASPLRFCITSINDSLQNLLKTNHLNSILVYPKVSVREKVYNKFSLPDDKLDDLLSVSVKYGDLNKKNVDCTLALPFARGKRYKLMQGYNGEYSHANPDSKYALDFKMETGEKISAVYDGTVIGVLDKYSDGAPDKKLLDFANYILIYHEQLGTYSKYVHIKYKGATVKNGDKVKQGAIIGFSGNVGYSTESHLHFCYYKPDPTNSLEEGLIAIPSVFENNLDGKTFKKGMWIENSN